VRIARAGPLLANRLLCGVGRKNTQQFNAACVSVAPALGERTLLGKSVDAILGLVVFLGLVIFGACAWSGISLMRSYQEDGKDVSN